MPSVTNCKENGEVIQTLNAALYPTSIGVPSEKSTACGGKSNKESNKSNRNNKKKNSVPKPSMEEVMDELQSRFLMNLPASELASSDRLFFQIEQCYWFYEDFYADHHAHLMHLKLNDFAHQMFNHCVLLQPLKSKCDHMFQDFKTYQSQIPVIGCILLNPMRTKLILVRNWKGTSWSLPRGKLNQGENDFECAKREVQEECGYDVSNTINEEDYIELYQNQQRIRMYIVTDVMENYSFAPQTRKEISLIQWFEFDQLPKKTWCVLPFLPRLKRWIIAFNKRQKNQYKLKKQQQQQPPTPTLHLMQKQKNLMNRSASAPRHRSGHLQKENAMHSQSNVLVNNLHTHQQTFNPESARSVSTPHARPLTAQRKHTLRGHFGTEQNTPTSHDSVNTETFGSVKCSEFNVDEMFRVNEMLTGQKFIYDGNPHDFGSTKISKTHPSGLLSFDTDSISSRNNKFIRKQSFEMHGGSLKDNIPLTASAIPVFDVNTTNSATSVLSLEKSKENNSGFTNFAFDTSDIMACVN